MAEKQVYVQGDFRFIKNDDLRNLFEKSYQNDDKIISTDSDMYFWAKEKIDEKTDDCWKSFVDSFDEDALVKEYNDKSGKLSFEYDKKNDNDGQIYIQDKKVTIPVGGKRKSRKSGKKTMRKSRKSRRKTKKSKKSKK